MSRSKKLRHPNKKPKPLPVKLVKTPLPPNGTHAEKEARLLRKEAKKAGTRVMRRRLENNPNCPEGHTWQKGVERWCQFCLEEVFVD